MQVAVIESPTPEAPEMAMCEYVARRPPEAREGKCVFTYWHTTSEGSRAYTCVTHKACMYVYPVVQTTTFEYFAGVPGPVTIRTTLRPHIRHEQA